MALEEQDIMIISQPKGGVMERDREDLGNKLVRHIQKKNSIQQRFVLPDSISKNSRMEQLERRYISFKRMRGLSASTVQNTADFFRVLYQFIAELTIDEENLSGLSYEEAIAAAKDTPIFLLETEGFEDFFREYLEKKELKPTTISTNMTRLATLYRYCSEELKVLQPKIFKIKAIQPPIKALYTDEQLDKLLERPKDYKNSFAAYRNWLIIQYVYNTGNRCRSVCNIKMRDLNEIDDGFVIVNTTKNKRPQRVVIPYEIVKLIKEYVSIWRSEASADDYLFCTQYGDYMESDILSRTIRAHIKKILGKDAPASIHLFRHQYAAEYIRDEGSMFDLQKQLGHSTLRMVQHYAEHYGVPNADNIVSHAPINRRKQKATRQKIKRT